MAPESLRDGVFTCSSDVWSYGVVLWEIVTLAAQPYQGLSNEQVLRHVIESHVLPKPPSCPDRLYALMRLCWLFEARRRPTFCQLLQLLETRLVPEFAARSWFMRHRAELSDEELKPFALDEAIYDEIRASRDSTAALSALVRRGEHRSFLADARAEDDERIADNWCAQSVAASVVNMEPSTLSNASPTYGLFPVHSKSMSISERPLINSSSIDHAFPNSNSSCSFQRANFTSTTVETHLLSASSLLFKRMLRTFSLTSTAYSY